jgi:drug/metabolite transporter (DMT)-like permease
MPTASLAELFALAAIWGGSFLFMRYAGADFGPAPLAALRALGAALVLMPLLVARGQLAALRQHWRPIALVGVTNSALPFLCFAIAALAITAGLSSVFNATTPLWGALFAWAWLGDRLDRTRVLGLAIGFLGVLWLAGDKASLKPGEHGVSSAVAIGACLVATLFYGWSASFAKRHLTGVPPLAIAAGSQVSATVVLLVPALAWWPASSPGPSAWGAALALAVICTALAYVLYFRLIAHIGPARTISVTFLIPVFAVLWGGLFLGESVTLAMAGGCAVVLLGTSLATGFWSARQAAPAAAATPAPSRGSRAPRGP